MHCSKFRFINLLLCVYALISYYCSIKYKFSVNNNVEYDLVIPCRFSDIEIFFRHKKFYRKFLNYSNIILIGPKKINESISSKRYISFIDENILISKKKLNEFLFKMRNIKTKRINWYFQQFLKLAYSRICKKEYYLIWDIDTIPIKMIKMFKHNQPYFDMKTEHHIPYFNTINRLIPGLKFIKRSYISEHMIIKTKLMKNLLDTIEMNYKIPGKLFWEKILMAIDTKDIPYSGFSEFETYGTFIDTKYPKYYTHRIWYSKRDARMFFGNSDNLDNNDIIWLSQFYHALSFENWIQFNKLNLFLVKDRQLQKLYKPNIFFMKFHSLFKILNKYNIK